MRKNAAASARELDAESFDDLRANALGILSDVRRDMLSRYPFIGSIAMNLDLVPTRDIDNPTACTDGSAIYFDIAFLADLKPDERMFVIAHEVWHNVMLHTMRRESREHSRFNIATDMEINQILKKDGFIAPDNLIWPDKYGFPRDLSAEEYYELLEAMPDNSIASMSGNGDSQSGNANGQMSGQFDKHVYVNDGADDGQTNSDKPNLADKYGKIGKDVNFRPMATESAVEKIREAAVAAAQEIERTRGTLPGHLKKIIDDLLEPQLNWREMLTTHVTRTLGEKSNWNSPNRRFAYRGTYLPTHDCEKLRIAVGIDTSGSTVADINTFLSELNGIVRTFGNYEITVIQCDTEVTDVATYNEDNPLDLENKKFETHGGGGTRLNPIIEHIKENSLEIDSMIMFTDGFCEEFTEDMAPDFPVLWVITPNGNTNTIHFGDVCEFKK